MNCKRILCGMQRYGRVLLLSPITILALTVPAIANDVTIVVKNIKSSAGTVRVAFYDEPDNWLKEFYNGQSRPASKGSMTFVFQDVPPGKYGVTVHQDVNDNNRFDTNFLGIPTEPYGFANNARGRFSAPTFDASAIIVENKPMRIVIRLK